ncbi:hypothetical protein [Flavobacterium polysaccharolyticum]|uniref:Uncharacterized protein n=1 Tax=Flavobacterium polysaccharolyticum TaxID=3133148 RepID=A0ABU9NQL5_9FLAO
MSLYHEVFQGESFSEQDYFEAVRYVLGPEYSNLGESELENVLLSRVDQMSESEAEGFWSSLGNVASSIGSGVLRGVSTIAPMAGTAIGTYFGAPQIGGALGGLVSNLAGSGATALSNYNQQNQQNQQRQQQPQPQRRYSPPPQRQHQNPPSQFRQTVNNTGRYLANAGRAALPAINQYIQDNPVQLNPQARQDIGRIQNLYGQLGGIINNPQFQAGQAQQSLGTASPNAPIESHSFAELIENVNYLTENILYEYYNGGFIPSEDYFVNEYGQLVGSNGPSRINRVQTSIASL